MWNIEGCPFEGFIAGAEKLRSGLIRELSYPIDGENRRNTPVFIVQVACTCGWRSPHMRAPSNTMWVPYCVLIASDAEDRGRMMWEEHAKHGHDSDQMLIGELTEDR